MRPDRSLSPYTPFDTVVVVGGTHGNERTGVTLVQHWQQNPDEVRREAFATRLLLANTEAIRKNVRFIDHDLNRCFLPRRLGDHTLQAYEIRRAREITAQLRLDPPTTRVFAIDLHTTTTRMGVTLITDDDPINLAVAAAAQERLAGSRIYCFADSERIRSCLRAAAHGGIGLEIGPIPQGVIRHETLDITRNAVRQILNVLDVFTREAYVPPDPQLAIYLHDQHVAYPETPSGAPPAFVHRALEGGDYRPLTKGQPVFEDLTGRTWPYAGADQRCPVFINEAAYYHENIAFSLTRKISLGSLLATH
ncbi:MAG: aspartoacylase [Desulfobacterales bacterium]|jgi:aspartoacylase